MTEYDSILKEKKKYEEPPTIKENTKKAFPWFKIDLLLITLLLIISYLIYFTTILNPKQIFLNDIKTVTNKYLTILEPLNLNISNYNLNGTINLKDTLYNFSLNKNKEITNLNLTLAENTLNYYTVSNENYLKLSNYKNQYYKLTKNNSFNLITNLKKYLTLDIPEDKFIKKFYLDGTNPIVESNLILKPEELKTTLNLNNKDNSYEVLLTFKNHAITNEIINMKITINNLTTNERKVISYEDHYLTYKDDNKNLKFQLEEKNKDFTIKIYQNNILYSVLNGTASEKNYKYTYQVIDKIYNINLNINKTDNNYNYELSSIIEQNDITETNNLTISFNFTNEPIFKNNELSNSISYDSLTEEEKNNFQTNLENIIGELRQFINNY